MMNVPQDACSPSFKFEVIILVYIKIQKIQRNSSAPHDFIANSYNLDFTSEKTNIKEVTNCIC